MLPRAYWRLHYCQNNKIPFFTFPFIFMVTSARFLLWSMALSLHTHTHFMVVHLSVWLFVTKWRQAFAAKTLHAETLKTAKKKKERRDRTSYFRAQTMTNLRHLLWFIASFLHQILNRGVTTSRKAQNSSNLFRTELIWNAWW